MDALSDDDCVGNGHGELLCVLREDLTHILTAAHQRKMLKMFKCPKCPLRTFTTKHFLRKHMAEHAKERCCNLCAFTSTSLKSVQEHMKSEHKNSDLACKDCSYTAVTGAALGKHQLRTHGKEVRRNLANFCCREALPETGASDRCQDSFHYRKELRKHLAVRHSLESALDKIEMSFTSKEKFALWKEDYEGINCVYYLRSKPQCGVTLYLCSRSGVHTSSGSGQRQTKSQGSAKLGFGCTSTLQVTERSGGTLAVVLYPFHYGHDTGASNMPFIRIPAADRAMAKEKLAAGVSPSQIMEDLRDYHSRDSEMGPSRTSRIQRKDLVNMCKSLGITPGGDNTKDPNKVTSVQTNAEKLQSSDKRDAAAADLVPAGRVSASPVVAGRASAASVADSCASDSVLPRRDVRISADGAHQLHRVERQQRQLRQRVSVRLAPLSDLIVPDTCGSPSPPSDCEEDSAAAVGLRRLCAGLDELKAQVSSLPDDTSDDALALMSAKLREVQQMIACQSTPTPRVTVKPPTVTVIHPTATVVPPTVTVIPPTATVVPPTVTVILPTATEGKDQASDTKIRPQPSESRRAKRPRAPVTGRTLRQRVNRSED